MGPVAASKRRRMRGLSSDWGMEGSMQNALLVVILAGLASLSLSIGRGSEATRAQPIQKLPSVLAELTSLRSRAH